MRKFLTAAQVVAALLEAILTEARKWGQLRLDQGGVTALGTVALKRRTSTEPNGTVLENGVRDNLFGAAGNVWFLNFGLDVVKNRSKADR